MIGNMIQNWESWPRTLDERLAWLRRNAAGMLAEPSQHSEEELRWARTMVEVERVVAIRRRETQSQNGSRVPHPRRD